MFTAWPFYYAAQKYHLIKCKDIVLLYYFAKSESHP